MTVPGPALSPIDVVLAQLEGLRDEARAGQGAGPGIRRAWEFASPANREATGPVERFADMVKSTVYGVLLEHRAAQLGPLLEHEGEAQQEVLVITAQDDTVAFTWVLSLREDPPYAGCWMTDGVLRHPDRRVP